MAIDQTLVARIIAGLAVQGAGQLVRTLNELDDMRAHGIAADINLADYDADFATQVTLQHVDGATLNKVLATVVVGVLSYLNTETIGADSYMEVLQKARR